MAGIVINVWRPGTRYGSDFTESGHSITSTVLSPVNSRISFHRGPSTSPSVDLLLSSGLKSPASSCFRLRKRST